MTWWVLHIMPADNDAVLLHLCCRWKSNVLFFFFVFVDVFIKLVFKYIVVMFSEYVGITGQTNIIWKMSWFDPTGFATLAKSALKEAQKTIDKALDIQDEDKAKQSNR